MFFECAQSLGGRLRAVSGDDSARLTEGMLRVAGRPARPGESEALLEFLMEARRKASASADPDASAWTMVAERLAATRTARMTRMIDLPDILYQRE